MLRLPLAEAWPASLAAVPGLPRGARLRVTVADHHARYLRLVWPEGVYGRERQAFVEHRFTTVFGPGPWIIRRDEDSRGKVCLAAALPAALAEALMSWARDRRVSVIQAEPAFVHAYNRLAGWCRGDGALARLEAGRLTIGLWKGGLWQAVRSQPVAASGERNWGCVVSEGLAGLLATLPDGGRPEQASLYLDALEAVPVGDLPAGWSWVERPHP